MAEIKPHRATRLHESLAKVAIAHGAMNAEISTHAERHTAELDARREGAHHEKMINDGIARQTSEIPANSQ